MQELYIIIQNYFVTQNPFIEIKRNQREAFNLIEKAVREAIRKMLPIKLILKEFLKNDYIPDDHKITNKISESQYINIKSMIDRDLNNIPEKQEIKENPVIDQNIVSQQNEYKEINDDKLMEHMENIDKKIQQSDDEDNYYDNQTTSESGEEDIKNADIFVSHKSDKRSDNNNEYPNLYPKKRITGNAKKILDKALDEIKNDDNKNSFFNKYTN